jgi:hypothetical protein
MPRSHPDPASASAWPASNEPAMAPGDDDACRAIAEEINQSHPQWLVTWGCYSRLLWAFPLFEMRCRMLVHASYPDALVARMNETELRFRIQTDQQTGDRRHDAQ